jgi:hypothetical protein
MDYYCKEILRINMLVIGSIDHLIFILFNIVCVGLVI